MAWCVAYERGVEGSTSQTVTDAHGVGAHWRRGSQTVTDTHTRRTRNTGAERHAPQLHELITVHTGWCERLSRLP